MTFATERFVAGEPVLRRRVVNHPTGPRTIWEAGAEFSHYDRHGHPVIRWMGGAMETVENHVDLKRAEV